MIKKDKMSKLFEDAIADAKAVRDTAMTNAKIALEEAFAPKLQAMFSEKIRQEAEGDNEDVDDVEELDTDEAPVEEGEEDIDLDDDEDLDEDIDIDFNETDEDLDEDVDINFEDEDESDETMKESDEDEDINLNLDEEEDVDINFEDEDLDEAKDDDIEIDFETEDDEEEKPVTEGEEDIDIDLDDDEDKEEEIKEGKKQIRSLTKKLQESISVITKLRKSLNETNLLNARLSYATQIFTKYGTLNDKQKLAIIDKFDEAETVKECKLVYSTLVESIKSRTKVPNQVKRITEGIASRITGTTAPSRKVLTESSDAIVKRFQKLANIK